MKKIDDVKTIKSRDKTLSKHEIYDKYISIAMLDSRGWDCDHEVARFKMDEFRDMLAEETTETLSKVSGMLEADIESFKRVLKFTKMLNRIITNEFERMRMSGFVDLYHNENIKYQEECEELKKAIEKYKKKFGELPEEKEVDLEKAERYLFQTIHVIWHLIDGAGLSRNEVEKIKQRYNLLYKTRLRVE